MNTSLTSAIFCIVAIGAAFAALSGTGTTTRYWDCCKPSCAWKENVGKLNPVNTCSKNGIARVNASVRSGCDSDGTSYVCNNLQPWSANDTLAYGYVAASFSGGVDNSKCGVCLKLSFTGTLAGKTMLVQNVNTGGDLGKNHFDIQIPGGGVGKFTRGCQTQWNAPSTGWGQQYGGVGSVADCNQLPKEIRSGCLFRFNWFKNADNPQVTFTQITCPKELTSRSGIINNS